MISDPPEEQGQLFSRILREHGKKGILIAAHERPDGDAAGSVSALLLALRENGYEADAVIPGDIPDDYAAFIPKEHVLSAVPPEWKGGLFIIADASTRARTAVQEFPAGAFVLNVDHHPDNEKFADAVILDPACCSTAELLFRLFRQAGLYIGKETATALLLGIVTDSGGFRYDNTAAGTLCAAGELLKLGADHHRIMVEVYFNRNIGYVKLEADLLLNRIRLFHEGKIALAVLTPELLDTFGVSVRNTETLVGTIRNLAGVEFAALLRPEKNGFKISLRTKNPPYSAGRVARRLNGGGHEMAAGGFIEAATEEEAVRILVSNIETELNS